MCYDVETNLRASLKRAIHEQDEDRIARIEAKLKLFEDHPFFHVSGFAHPDLVLFTSEEPWEPRLLRWGLVPFWVKDKDSANQLMNRTLNARGETIFEKPSFRASAKSKRAVLYLNGFYEHHHKNKKTFPYHVSRKDGEPFPVACLFDEWVDKTTGEILPTFSIVTTAANPLMARIHNNPKAKDSRMPVILSDDEVDIWLDPAATKEEIEKLIDPYPEEELKAYTVGKLRGKEAIGNNKEVLEEVEYPELAELF